MGLWISGSMGHGNCYVILQLVSARLVLGVYTVAFKNSLHGPEYDLIIIIKNLGQLSKGWEPHPLTARSPVLKEIEIYYFAPVVA